MRDYPTENGKRAAISPIGQDLLTGICGLLVLCNRVVHRSRTCRNRSIVRLRQASIVQGSSIFGIKHASMTKKGPTRCKVHSRSFRLSGYSIWMAGPRRLSRWVWEQRQGASLHVTMSQEYVSHHVLRWPRRPNPAYRVQGRSNYRCGACLD